MASAERIWHTAPFEGIWAHIDKLAALRSGDDWYTNYNILGQAASMVEGAFEALLRVEVGSRIDREENEATERLLKELDARITRASGFAALRELYPVIFGTELRLIVGNDINEAVLALFKLRNASTAHGRFMNSIGPDLNQASESDSDPYRWESGALNEVQRFLRKKKAWVEYGSPRVVHGFWCPPEPGSFFSNPSVDFLYLNALKYLSALGALSTIGSSPGYTSDLLHQDGAEAR